MKKERLSDNHEKGKKVFDIVSWVVVGILFISALTLLITKKSNGAVVMFGSRYDVVLSESMSYKNEAHKDFLEGHDDQIQKMDVVRSKTVDKNTELNIYDIVLFNDPHIKGHPNMHRIVDKKVDIQDEIYLQEANIVDNNILLPNNNSALYTNTISFKHLEVTFSSSVENFSEGYYFALNNDILDKVVVTTQSGDNFLHHVTIDKSSDRPGIFKIIHSKAFDYSSEVITNIQINSSNGEINADGSNFIYDEETSKHQYFTNTSYLYELRGDAAKTEDGWFGIENIYSKVNKIIPKAGYFVSYITSIPGIIMIVGLGLLIIGVDFGLEFINKKEKEKNKIHIYYLSEWESLSYITSKGEDISKEGTAKKVGVDRYGANIYEIEVDIAKYDSITFFKNEEEKIEPISLINVESGTGFYKDEEGIKSYMHKQENKKGDSDENQKK